MNISKLHTKINKVFSDLSFDNSTHTYYWKGVRVKNSVSALVSFHSPKFNVEAILPYSAEKQSKERNIQVSISQLREEWKQINIEACKLGTETHEFMERFTGIQTPITNQQKAGVKFFQDYSSEYEILFKELRMYSKNYLYAGTEDLILQHRSTGKIITADYKTNKDLFKCYKNQTLLEPFSYLEATPYNKIQLQLSYYQIMLEDIDLLLEDRWLIYLKNDGNYQIFKLWDFTKDLRKYMEDKIPILN